MNTAWVWLYCSGLTNVCALLFFQCCGTELGRRSSGNRYRRDHLWHIIITLHQVFIGKTCYDDWLFQIIAPTLPSALSSMLLNLFSKACLKNDTPQVRDSVFGPDDNWVWSVQYSTSANRISWVIGFLCRFIDHLNQSDQMTCSYECSLCRINVTCTVYRRLWQRWAGGQMQLLPRWSFFTLRLTSSPRFLYYQVDLTFTLDPFPRKKNPTWLRP